uniref:Glutaminyl-tRNA synthetase class Ib non-specific RNA-binding domain-containing protein n=1 Tax=Glossina austeni TaxID=7395 RepID=A0A1A9VH87_GLOAU
MGHVPLLIMVAPKNLQLALAEVGGSDLPEGAGMLLYHLAIKIKPQIADHLPLLTRYIVAGKLNSAMKVDASLEYLLKLGQKIDINVDIEQFEHECGVKDITPEEIEKLVQKLIQKHKETLLEQRYHFNSSKIMQEVREHLKWADGKSVKAAIDVEIFDFLGPKTEKDLKPSTKSDKKKDKSEASDKGDSNKSLKKDSNMENDEGAHTHRLSSSNSFTSGSAININFGYAAAYGGICYLRYDDTNLGKEEEKFFTGIRDMVE